MRADERLRQCPDRCRLPGRHDLAVEFPAQYRPWRPGRPVSAWAAAGFRRGLPGRMNPNPNDLSDLVVLMFAPRRARTSGSLGRARNGRRIPNPNIPSDLG
ncbi:hypothetical protein MTBLM5_50102 [Magnetospirillum sp. LM-5]|nr:hypothetical protein MTBLM5_50102 [Magnetospirillum sp. LM-5]